MIKPLTVGEICKGLNINQIEDRLSDIKIIRFRLLLRNKKLTDNEIRDLIKRRMI